VCEDVKTEKSKKFLGHTYAISPSFRRVNWGMARGFDEGCTPLCSPPCLTFHPLSVRLFDDIISHRPTPQGRSSIEVHMHQAARQHTISAPPAAILTTICFMTMAHVAAMPSTLLNGQLAHNLAAPATPPTRDQKNADLNCRTSLVSQKSPGAGRLNHQTPSTQLYSFLRPV